MKKIFTYLLFSILIATSYAQNWQQVGDKIKTNQSVSVLYVDSANDFLYIGGWFAKIEKGIPIGSYSLIRIKNGKEEVLDSVISNKVYAIYPYKGDLYIGGNFQNMGGRFVLDTTLGQWKLEGGLNTSLVARLHNDTFQVVNSIKNTNGEIYSFTEHNGNLIIGGIFDSLAGIISKGVLAYDGKNFSPLGGGVLNNGSQYVYSLNTYRGNLFAGGNFYGLTNSNQVDGTTEDFQGYSDGSWTRVNGWYKNSAFGYINSMVEYKSEMYISGYFQEKEGGLTNSIIKYDGTFFYSLGGGALNHNILDMTVHNDELFVCGSFDNMDGIKASGLAKWNGKHWCSLGADTFKRNIEDLVFYRDTLYITGGFRNISGQKIRSLAKWIGAPKMEHECAPSAVIKKVNYNLGFSENELTNLKFNVYPNPANHTLTVDKLKNAGIYTFVLRDVNGKQILSGEIIESNTKMDVSELNTGLYLLEISNNIERLTKRVMIE